MSRPRNRDTPIHPQMATRLRTAIEKVRGLSGQLHPAIVELADSAELALNTALQTDESNDDIRWESHVSR